MAQRYKTERQNIIALARVTAKLPETVEILSGASSWFGGSHKGLPAIHLTETSFPYFRGCRRERWDNESDLVYVLKEGVVVFCLQTVNVY